ncbi:MAG: Holliday junction branch migration protein RuvA [Lentisphaerae bacterium]|jgi:Holliday junction DNA helicase RuvA|nr:Holliday junction branch migration protein RuvA [Lentisphaerota bacterium]
MIAQLTGTVIEADFTSVILDVNGVGYGLSIPLSTFDILPPPGQRVTLRTAMLVRQDDIQLYGFGTKEEMMLFTLLTTQVSGIGPKLALNVLSSLSIADFANAIAEGDLKLLSKISGIGKRTAERMVVELRDKIAKLGFLGGSSDASSGSESGLRQDKSLPPEARDAIAALETLGFKRDIAAKAVASILEKSSDSPSTESLIRKSLALLNS